MSEIPAVTLKAGRDRPARGRHPWILSGSVGRIDGDPEAGATVAVRAADGERLGLGDWDPHSQIRVRLFSIGALSHDASESWLDERIDAAMEARREDLTLASTNAVRLLNAEGDGVPGLIVDRYDDRLVLKAATPAMRRRVSRVAETIAKQIPVRGAWLRGDAGSAGPGAAAGAEAAGPEPGTDPQSRLVCGEPPPDAVEIEEDGRGYVADLRRGHKTGFYLDQRDGRSLVRRLSRGRRVLDLYCYTGGFAAAALQGGAAGVVAVESSEPAVRLLERNACGAEIVQGDAGRFLRDDDRRFDLLVCDPPPLARRRRDVRAACRAYLDLNRELLRHAERGARVLTYTCSHHVDAGLFRRVVFSAVRDAGAEVSVLGILGAPSDHPVALHHPEGEYLKGLDLRVLAPGR